MNGLAMIRFLPALGIVPRSAASLAPRVPCVATPFRLRMNNFAPVESRRNNDESHVES